MQDITRYIDNDILIEPKKPFGVIFGLNPSKGARSPKLWNKAFAYFGIEADFHAFDVQENNFSELINVLKDHDNFIGGAVAVPYKEKILKYLDSIEPEARMIGAVNAIYRDNENKLTGANTDGLAALQCLQALDNSLHKKNILVIGLGGAGKAVASYLVNKSKKLFLYNRTKNRTERFLNIIDESGFSAEKVENLSEIPSNIDVVINCTSLGYSGDSQENKVSPLTEGQINSLQDNAIVFDIIYQPPETELVKISKYRGLVVSNGLRMNLLQAALAFNKAFNKYDIRTIMDAMSKA